MDAMKSGDYLILLYHGVLPDNFAPEGSNSSGKHIPVSLFEHQMSIVANGFNPVSMLDIAQAHMGAKELPDRAVAVTFDDGFANVPRIAFPVLRKFGIPMTFYVATGFIETGLGSWTDQLELMLLKTDVSNIKIDIQGHNFTYQVNDVGSKVVALKDIKQRCKQIPFEQVQLILNQVQSQCGVEFLDQSLLYAMATWPELIQMEKNTLVNLGAHTISHVPIGRVPHEKMTEEVAGSLEAISQKTNHPCELFSYPEGQLGDFDQNCIEFLKRIGLSHCPTAIPGINNVIDTDPFLIARTMVGFEGRSFPLN